MRMIILGAPGSGKGTQSVRIAERFGIPAISTGEIFRTNIREGTELGRQVKEVIEGGDLVSDELTGKMVHDRLAQPDAAAGFLLDGYPRNRAQISALDGMLHEAGAALDVALQLVVNEDEVIQRLARRAQIEGRADDNEDVLRRRMAVYHRETEPVSGVYRERGVLREISGEGSTDDVFDRLIEAIEGARPAQAR